MSAGESRDGSGRLTGRVALVTGASSGIGAATARALAAEGAVVVAAARREERLLALRDEVAAAGVGRVVPRALDVTDEDACRRVVAESVEELGGLHVLVNNAGVAGVGAIVDGDVASWRHAVEVNVVGLMTLTGVALPHLLDAAPSDVVNVASASGRRVPKGSTSGVYAATKFAVVGFTEGLRAEVTTRGVRATVVEPGFVDTEIHEGRDWDIRVLRPEDVADLVVHAVTRPPHVSVNEIMVRPTDQLS